MRLSVTLRAALLSLALAGAAAAAAPVTVQREGVLGTSFDMQVHGVGRWRAARAVDAALDEIARLEHELSTWRDDSALSAYNAGRVNVEALPADVTNVLALCERWREETSGAFSCRLGALVSLWKKADADEHLPDRAELRRQARAIAALAMPQHGPLDPAAGLRYDVDGIAKGYVLDRALAAARRAAPKATGLAIDIGGDAVYFGHPDGATAWRVDVADPQQPVDNAPGIAHAQLHSQAIAASGHRSRGYRIGRRQLSHIIDPNDGWPLAYAPSATVVAPDAATADALATALSVLPIREGLALADRLDGVAALIVSDAGIAFASARWPGVIADAPQHPARIVIDYEIPAHDDAPRYRQPYLALWIERDDGTPVRQLHVLGDRSRWLGELPRWWRHYGRNDPAGALGIARPTRAPGHYTVAWDGRDDRGREQASGRYVLRVEAAREHGGHEDLSLPFVLGERALGIERHGESEIGRIVVRDDAT
jgi:thiamine biosynthesis lipoprotein